MFYSFANNTEFKNVYSTNLKEHKIRVTIIRY